MPTTEQTYDVFDAAEHLAPQPANRDQAADHATWARHYAAEALAAHARFRAELDTPSPTLGYLSALAVASTAAAVALMTLSPGDRGRLLWDLTPEAGALNGEYIDWLAEFLDAMGINPADIYPWYEAADFTSPSRRHEIEQVQAMAAGLNAAAKETGR